jgi:hypothetical protein
MDFIASLLPIAISVRLSVQTARLILEPTSYVSFFGLCWIPYHDDLPYRLLRDALVAGFINAVLSLLAPRFPRLLKAYSTGASPKLPFNGQKLLLKNDWWIIAFTTISLGGWLGNSIGMNLPYRFMVGLALYTMIAAVLICILLQTVRILWIYIRHYPERPPLGLVTRLLWPPLHPLRRFLLRTGNKLGRSLESSSSNPSAAEELVKQKEI